MEPAELDPRERALLWNLTFHEGFGVLIKVMEHACQEATKRVILCDPMEKDKLAALHMQARSMNEFCTHVRKEINYSGAIEPEPEPVPQ